MELVKRGHKDVRTNLSVQLPVIIKVTERLTNLIDVFARLNSGNN